MKLSPRRVVVAALSLAAAASVVAAAGGADPRNELTGGATTVWATGRNAFSFPFANLDDDERRRFAIGNSFFRRNWVEPPSSTGARDGLGPHFIARSCGGCHDQDGRGAPPDPAARPPEQPVALLMRLSVPGQDAHGGPMQEPAYGDQFNNAGITGVRPEGRVTIARTPIRGRFRDGTAYTLWKPAYGFAGLGYGPMSRDVMTSPRVAPHIAGVGLIEAIPDDEIVRNEAEQAAAPGPVKGRVNRVWDEPSKSMRVGKLGWKANVATIAHQTAAAFVGDIGITSTTFPHEPCMPVQKDCLAAPRGGATPGAPEIDDKTLADVIFYQSTLAPAARRDAADRRMEAGEKLFGGAGCASCHRPGYVTGPSPSPALASPKGAGQRIFPYTDLLLHDMGPDLADGRPDFLASGRQWRTAPLWGVGLIHDVNGHRRLMHDGRANGVLEAILWHGGEAEDAKQKVLRMSRADREALVRYVESL